MAKRLTKQEKWDRNLRAARMIRACVNGLIADGIADDEDVMDEFSGIIAEWIFRNPVRHSGYISVEALNSSKIPTDDHYFGRKSSGILLYRYALRGASVKRLAYIIASRSRCHQVTSEQNTELKKHDTRGLLKPKSVIKAEYDSAEIVMVKKQIVVYIINDIEYDTLTAAALAHNTSPITVKNRCTQDKRGKFPSWKSEIR
jgi:hypothetical protein